MTLPIKYPREENDFSPYWPGEAIETQSFGNKRKCWCDLGDSPSWEGEGKWVTDSGGIHRQPLTYPLVPCGHPYHRSTLAGRDTIYHLGYGFYARLADPACCLESIFQKTLSLIFPLISTMEQEICSEEKE